MQNNHRFWTHAICIGLIGFLLLCSFTGCKSKEEPEATSAQAETEAVLTEAQTDALSPVAEETAVEQTDAVSAQDETDTTASVSEETTAAEDETTEAPAEEKAPQTKAEIISYFNESMNRVKPNAKSIKTNYVLNTQTSDATLSNKMLQNIANKLISANMGYDKKQEGLTFNTLNERNAGFPVRGQTWSSKLTESDVSSATCTEKDGKYIIELKLIPDTTPNIKAGEGHAGKAFSIVTKDQIVEGAGSLGMSVIEEDSIKLTFKDCRITVKVDKETGNVESANYYQDWTLSLTALGIDVSVSFGAEDDFSILW